MTFSLRFTQCVLAILVVSVKTALLDLLFRVIPSKKPVQASAGPYYRGMFLAEIQLGPSSKRRVPLAAVTFHVCCSSPRETLKKGKSCEKLPFCLGKPSFGLHRTAEKERMKRIG